MKRMFEITMILLFIAVSFGLMACGPDNDLEPPGSEATPPVPDNPDSEPGYGRYLVIYYSRSGNTRSVATEICKQVNGTLLEVETSSPYPSDYNEVLSIAQQEIRTIDNEGIYPSVETVVENFDDYDRIFICTPPWYSRMATPMQSFLHAHARKLDNKNLSLVVTSASSGISSVIEDAHRLCPEAIYSGEALWIRDALISTAHDILARWLETLGIIGAPDNSGNEDNNGNNETMNRNITVKIGETSFSATLEDNQTARVFSAMLPVTLNMDELNGNEKYYYLSENLPTNTFRPGTIHTGDLLLYGSNCIVLFYETFTSSYSYTSLGKIDNPDGLAVALGKHNVMVTFEKSN